MNKKFKSMGITTALEYILKFDNFANNILKSKTYHSLFKNLLGEEGRELNYEKNYVKSVGSEKTLLDNPSSLSELRFILLQILHEIILKAKKIHVLPRSFCLKIQYANHSSPVKSYHFSIKKHQLNIKLIKNLFLQKLDNIFLFKKVRLLGCYLTNIINKYDQTNQLNIFEIIENKDHNIGNIGLIIDLINSNFEKRVIYTTDEFVARKANYFQNKINK